MNRVTIFYRYSLQGRKKLRARTQNGGDKKGRKMPDGDANAFYPAYRIGIRRPDKALTPP
ncbi:hypothetical protein HMPREF3207_00021, partial [Citrobacter koseri]